MWEVVPAKRFVDIALTLSFCRFTVTVCSLSSAATITGSSFIGDSSAASGLIGPGCNGFGCTFTKSFVVCSLWSVSLSTSFSD